MQPQCQFENREFIGLPFAMHSSVDERVENDDTRRAPGEPAGCVTCPLCAATLTKRTIKSHRGHYRICEACGYMWHHDDRGGR